MTAHRRGTAPTLVAAALALVVAALALGAHDRGRDDAPVTAGAVAVAAAATAPGAGDRGTPAQRAEVESRSARDLAEEAVATRPAAPAGSQAGAGARRAAYAFTITTFNLLGSQHTAPGGSASEFAPGRVRTEWGADLVSSYASDVVGFSEMQADQLVAMQAAMPGYSFYPGTALGGSGVPTNVMWRSDVFETTWQSSFRIPFMGGTRPMPIVRLRHKASGGEVYVINIHNSPNDRKGREWERDKAEAIEIAAVKKLRKDGLPILLVGDFNEHAEVFCRITRAAAMVSASGGSNAGSCKPPKVMRVDWIFGTRDATYSGFRLDQGVFVRRITDHAVLSTVVNVPAA